MAVVGYSGSNSAYGGSGEIGASTANQYISTLFAKKVLKLLASETVYNEITNRDHEGEFKSQGDTIKIRQAPAVPTEVWTKGAPLLYTAPSADALTMEISEAFYQATQVDDLDKLQMDVDLLNMYAESARESAQVKLDTNILLYMSTAAHASNVGVTAGAVSANINLGADSATTYVGIDRTNALDKIVEIGQVLGEQNLGNEDRYVVIPEWMSTRLKLSDLKAADMTGDTVSPVRSGLIGSINKTKIYVNNHIAKGTTNTGAYAIIGGTKMATSMAIQLNKVETLRSPDQFGDLWRSMYVFGRKTVRPEGMAVLWAMPS